MNHPEITIERESWTLQQVIEYLTALKTDVGSGTTVDIRGIRYQGYKPYRQSEKVYFY